MKYSLKKNENQTTLDINLKGVFAFYSEMFGLSIVNSIFNFSTFTYTVAKVFWMTHFDGNEMLFFHDRPKSKINRHT